MRDIKFRAWDKKNREMLKIGLVNLDVDTLIFMQYTGLKDKNGKEVYDGDIIYWSCDDFEENVVVFWDDEHLRWSIYQIENKLAIDCLYEYSESDEIEVIGNIYEKGVKK